MKDNIFINMKQEPIDVTPVLYIAIMAIVFALGIL